MKSKPLIIILLGPPGSGKGTQAKLICRKFKLDYFGSGEALRERAKIKDFTGKKIEKILKAGKWMEESVIIKIWLDKFEQIKRKKNFRGLVYDGGPRKLLEAKLLTIALRWYEWDKNVKVIYIKVSFREAFERLIKRRQCKVCREIIPWIDQYKKIKNCPKCGGKLIFRTDDKPSAIKKRFSEFRKYTLPTLRYLKTLYPTIEINGEQSIENVFRDIEKNLN